MSRLRASLRGFTLLELLAVMGILVLLAVLTVTGVGRISKDARISTAVNRITSALGNARALAIKENTLVLVVFRVNWPTQATNGDPCAINQPPINAAARQATEIVIARASGEAEVFYSGPANSTLLNLADRFVPVPGVAPVRLPAGIKVAGPHYEINEDLVFVTQGEMKELFDDCGEAVRYSQLVGILFGPDGRRLTRNPSGASGDHKLFVDWNDRDCVADPFNDSQDVDYSFGCGNGLKYWFMDHPRDETNVNLLPFLVVYDDDAAREQKGTDWSIDNNMLAELVGANGYIAKYGQRIDFNPNTGAVQP